MKEAADCIVRVVDTVEPEQELVEKYDVKYRKFVQIYPAVKALYEM